LRLLWTSCHPSSEFDDAGIGSYSLSEELEELSDSTGEGARGSGSGLGSTTGNFLLSGTDVVLNESVHHWNICSPTDSVGRLPLPTPWAFLALL
jgi:hypothetical protein